MMPTAQINGIIEQKGNDNEGEMNHDLGLNKVNGVSSPCQRDDR